MSSLGCGTNIQIHTALMSSRSTSLIALLTQKLALCGRSEYLGVSKKHQRGSSSSLGDQKMPSLEKYPTSTLLDRLEPSPRSICLFRNLQHAWSGYSTSQRHLARPPSHKQRRYKQGWQCGEVWLTKWRAGWCSGSNKMPDSARLGSLMC